MAAKETSSLGKGKGKEEVKREERKGNGRENEGKGGKKKKGREREEKEQGKREEGIRINGRREGNEVATCNFIHPCNFVQNQDKRREKYIYFFLSEGSCNEKKST